VNDGLERLGLAKEEVDRSPSIGPRLDHVVPVAMKVIALDVQGVDVGG
jgi:hypothetical protein